MGKKWSNEKIDALIEHESISRDQDLTNVSQPSVTKIQWKCKDCDMSWFATFDSVRRGSRCPHCAGNYPMTADAVNAKLEHSNFKCVALGKGTQQRERLGTFSCTICFHQWSTTLSNVTSNKQGCPKCNKSGKYTQHWFDTHPQSAISDAFLYVVRMWNGSEQFIKLGITRRSVSTRFASITAYDHLVLQVVQVPLYHAWRTEQLILKLYSSYSFNPTAAFGGHSECLSIDIETNILNLIGRIHA